MGGARGISRRYGSRLQASSCFEAREHAATGRPAQPRCKSGFSPDRPACQASRRGAKLGHEPKQRTGRPAASSAACRKATTAAGSSAAIAAISNTRIPRSWWAASARWEDRVLLCRRAINPRRGFWTLPAGYMELNETTAEGAKREAWEEARAKIELRASARRLQHPAAFPGPAHLSGPRWFRPRWKRGRKAPRWGCSTGRRFLGDELAFPSVRWALDHYRAGAGEAGRGIESNPPGEWGDY